jgi:hypothetical protein
VPTLLHPRSAMPAMVLIIALICIPLIVGACLATASYRAYRARCLLEYDAERAQDVDNTRHAINSIEMRDLESVRSHHRWPQPESHSKIVPPIVAPIVKPFRRTTVEIKGMGGGFVEHYGPTNGEPRKASEESRYESGRGYASETTRSSNQFENADRYAGPGWQWNNEHLP